MDLSEDSSWGPPPSEGTRDGGVERGVQPLIPPVQWLPLLMCEDGEPLSWPAASAPSQGSRRLARRAYMYLFPFPVPCSLQSRVLSQMPGVRQGLPGFPCPALTLFLVSQASHHSASYLLHCHRLHRDHSPGHLPLGSPARAWRKAGPLATGSTSSLDTVTRKFTPSF